MTGRDYLRVLAKRWPTIVAGFAAALIVAIAVGLLTPASYAARTQIFVSTLVDPGNVNQQLFQGGSFAAERVKSYTDLATSPRVTVPAVATAGADISPDELEDRITADTRSGTVLINIEVTDGSPDQAAALTNAVAGRLAEVIQELETPPGAPQSPVRAAMVVPAGPPTSPVVPNWPLTIALGVLAGLVLGVGAAIVREALDGSVSSEEDLQRVTDVPNLGKIVFDDAAQNSPINHRDARSEPFRQLRTNIQFTAVGSTTQTLVVTSAVASEGKSSVTGNLAVAMAQLGLRVAVVDADLRHPVMAEYFRVSNDVGLTSILLGRTTLEAALQTVRPNLSLLASGPIPPNPSELLSTDPVWHILDALADGSDIVLIDSAPVLPVTDSRVVASRCDGVLLVVRAGSTNRRQVGEAVESLRKVQARVLGTVLNRLPANEAEGSYYGRYGAEPARDEAPLPVPHGQGSNGHVSNGSRHRVTPYPRAHPQPQPQPQPPSPSQV
jgi:polysaccharide biosynthesis transport protein